MAAVSTVETAGGTFRILESCHSLWLFDPCRMRFRRLPRGVDFQLPGAEREWATYHTFDLELSTGMLVVGLNLDGTQLLRAWVHTDLCRHCGAPPPTAPG